MPKFFNSESIHEKIHSPEEGLTENGRVQAWRGFVIEAIGCI
jgi:hypothetical protein